MSLRFHHILCDAINYINNSDLSDMAELPVFLPPTSESTIEYRTSPLRQACIRPKLKAACVHIVNCDYQFKFKIQNTFIASYT